MKKKIAITFPQLHEFGGGEIFCEYVCNLLASSYDIDLYYYKTGLINKNINFNKKINLIGVRSKNIFLNFFFKKFIFLSQIYLIYILNNQYNNKPYKFLFSAAGEFVSNNYKVYQYIHHPFYSLNFKHYLAIGTKKYEIHKFILRFFLSFFMRFYFLINKKSYSKNKSLLNSKWTQKRFFEIYKKKSLLIYPTFNIPNQEKLNFSKFLKRKNNFIILGRVGSDKNTFKAIKVFSKIKHQNKDLKLNKLLIIGPIKESIKKKVEYYKNKYRSDIKFLGHVTYLKRNNLLKNNKYGLHLCEEEHFGRSLLEMNKKGMICFTHNSGGAVEITNSNLLKFKKIYEFEINLRKIILNKKIQKKILEKNFKIFDKKFTTKKFNKEIIKSLV